MSAAIRPKSAKFLDPGAERNLKSKILDNMVNRRPISRHSRAVPSMAAISSVNVDQDAVKQVIRQTSDNADMMKFLQDDSIDDSQIDIRSLENLKDKLLRDADLQDVTRFHQRIVSDAGTGTDVNQRGKELLKRNTSNYSTFFKAKDLGGRSGINPIQFCAKPPIFKELMRQPASLLENHREARIQSTTLNRSFSNTMKNQKLKD